MFFQSRPDPERLGLRGLWESPRAASWGTIKAAPAARSAAEPIISQTAHERRACLACHSRAAMSKQSLQSAGNYAGRRVTMR